jgi:hypothetical protein
MLSMGVRRGGLRPLLQLNYMPQIYASAALLAPKRFS